MENLSAEIAEINKAVKDIDNQLENASPDAVEQFKSFIEVLSCSFY